MANRTPAELLGARYQQVLHRNQQVVRQMQAPAQPQAQAARHAQAMPQVAPQPQAAKVIRKDEVMEPKIAFTAKVPRPKGTTKSERTMIGLVAGIFFVWFVACSAYIITYVLSGM